VSTLEIRDLHASITEADGSLREILRGVDLRVEREGMKEERR